MAAATAAGTGITTGLSAGATDRLADARLLADARAGDGRALGRLLEPHEAPLYRLCLGVLHHPQDAEDAVQEAFIRAIKSLGGFRADAGLRTWLYRIALNVCLERKRSARPVEPLYEETLVTEAGSLEDAALARMRAMEALATLKPHHRAALVMKEVEGFSVEEIGAAMGWNRKKAENELYQARRALAEWRLAQQE